MAIAIDDTKVQDSNPFPDDVKAVFRGIGQVMFQDNALTGLLFLIGIAIASPIMAAGCIGGAIIGTVTARLLKFDETEYKDGIYGFNASLVGLAAFFFFLPSPLTIALLVVGCVLAPVLTMALRRGVPIPTYTSAFVIVTWMLFAAGERLELPKLEHPPAPETLDIGAAFTEGLSEVFLQANRVTGILFFVAIAVNNWRHALLALIGSIVGTAVGLYHQDPYSNVSIGIYGYNGSLTAIAIYLWRKSSIAIFLGVILSTPLTEHFPQMGLPTLTAPFILASWIVLLLGKADEFCLAKSPES